MQNSKNNKNKEIDMTKGAVYEKLLLFFFPLLGSSFFQQLYNTADALIVGRYAGKIALSAVGGSSSTILTIFINFFFAMTGGAAVAISLHYGARNEEEVSRTTHTAIILSLCIGAAVCLTGFILSPAMLEAIGNPPDLMEDSIAYMRIFFIGMTPNLLYNMCSAILRAVGDSRRPLFFLMFSCILNIVLDLVFVAVLGLGVRGAAWATVICQILSAILSLLTLLHSPECYGISLPRLKVHRSSLIRILRLGIPSGMQSLMYTVANAIIQAGINAFGTNTVAAWTAYGKIDLLYWMLMASLGTSIMTFAGQNYGAGKLDRVKEGVKACSVLTILLSVLSCALIMYFARPLFSLFVSDPEVIAIGKDIMVLYITPAYITYSQIEVYSGTLRGMGDAVNPLIICGVCICAFRILWIMLALPRINTLSTLVLCYPLSWTLCSIVFFIYFRRKMKRLENLMSKR